MISVGYHIVIFDKTEPSPEGFFISDALILFRCRNSGNEVTMYDEFEGF